MGRNTDIHKTLDVLETWDDLYRWKLGVGTNPCIKTRIGNRCNYCGFLDVDTPLHPDEVGNYITAILASKDTSDMSRVELYVSGSFFDEQEVSLASRHQIIQAFSATSITELVVESRPEFITTPAVLELTQIIDPERLTIAVGVETTHDDIRTKMNKGFSLSDVEDAISCIAQSGARFQAYILLKAPGMHSDAEALVNLIESARYLADVCHRQNCRLTIAVQPLMIVQGTGVHTLYNRGLIRPPWVYTIALSLHILDTMRTNQRLAVILGNEMDNFEPVAISANYAPDGSICPCSQHSRACLHNVNSGHQAFKDSIVQILSSTCSCKKQWLQEIEAFGQEIPESWLIAS